MMTPEMMALFELFLPEHKKKDDEEPVEMEADGQ